MKARASFVTLLLPALYSAWACAERLLLLLWKKTSKVLFQSRILASAYIPLDMHNLSLHRVFFFPQSCCYDKAPPKDERAFNWAHDLCVSDRNSLILSGSYSTPNVWVWSVYFDWFKIKNKKCVRWFDEFL